MLYFGSALPKRTPFAERHHRSVGFIVGALCALGLYPLIDALLDRYVETLIWIWAK